MNTYTILVHVRVHRPIFVSVYPPTPTYTYFAAYMPIYPYLYLPTYLANLPIPSYNRPYIPLFYVGKPTRALGFGPPIYLPAQLKELLWQWRIPQWTVGSQLCIESSDLATIACDYNYTYTYTPTYTPKPKHCCPHCFHGATMHCLAPGPTRALYFLYTYVCLIYTCTPTQNRRTCACTAAQTSYFGASRQTWLPDRASAALRLKQPNCCVGRLLLRAI